MLVDERRLHRHDFKISGCDKAVQHFIVFGNAKNNEAGNVLGTQITDNFFHRHLPYHGEKNRDDVQIQRHRLFYRSGQALHIDFIHRLFRIIQV